MKTNQDYKNEALAALKGHWAPAVLAAVVYMFIVGGISFLGEIVDPQTTPSGTAFAISGVVVIISLFLVAPIEVGIYNAYKNMLFNGDSAVLPNMFKIGFGKWGRVVWGMLLMGIFEVLWTLLFIIPGLIKSFAYALTPFILVDNPELSANEAIDLSQKMMKGHKFDLFWLMLSFIGWILLAILTAGIGLFWLVPYMYTSVSAFYQDVKADYELKNSIN